MAESQRRRLVLGRWRDHWSWWLLRTAVLVGLVVLAGIVWRRWGLAGLALACGMALVGGLIVWAVAMPGRLAPPVPTEILAKITDPQARLEVTDARTRLHHDLRNGALQLLTVVAVLVGAGVGFQQLAEDRDQASQDRDQAIQDRQLTRQGQASERFTRAIDQLGSSRVETRIGGIYGLDQIAEQSPENAGPVGEVLLAWFNSRPRSNHPQVSGVTEYAPDVQAVLTVLTRQVRYRSIIARGLYTSGLDLRGLGLISPNLNGAYLDGADMSITTLIRANLERAILRRANLERATLYEANLRRANLRRANLRRARLGLANLRGADLEHANLRRADLRDAKLEHAKLRAAQVDGRTRWPAGFDWRSAGVQVVP